MPNQIEDQLTEALANDDDGSASVYDITSTPNDFNILTTVSFMESGRVEIPPFQRNFIWDMQRSSRLIESLIMGLPVPQVFLYEKEKKTYQIIDGQQRLLSIYYFVKQKFPREDKTNELRKIFFDNKGIPDSVLHDKNYFVDFNLKFRKDADSKFSGLKYSTLGEYKTDFDLRTIRNIIIKQNEPEDDDSSIYEVFNRLNTGGINLKAQEIRMSMYYSSFYRMLVHLNENRTWREVLQLPEPHPHFSDVEILLRAFSFLLYRDIYTASISRFLNKSSKRARDLDESLLSKLTLIFEDFIQQFSNIPRAFFNQQRNRFNVALFESVFYASCFKALDGGEFYPVTEQMMNNIASLSEFTTEMQEGTAKAINVKRRFDRAEAIICK